MAINLAALNATELIPQKVNNNQPVAYKLDPDKLKENWEEKKASATDLIAESKLNGSYRESVSLDGAGVSGISAGKGYTCNYSLDAFFRKDMPLISDSNGNFTVGGAVFSEDELKECRAVMKAAVDQIGCGIGKNSNIDYNNYAEMELAAAGVRAYAAANLTEKQAKVVNKAMVEYNEALVRLQNDTLSAAGAVDLSGTELSKYYGKGIPIPKGIYEASDNINSDYRSYSGSFSATQTATNDDLIGKIRDLFSNVDYSNPKSLDAATDKYRGLVAPARTAFGAGSSGSYLTGLLNRDVSGLQNLFRNMLNVIRYRSVDYSV